MWKIADVVPGHAYRLGLCQAPDGRRLTVLIDASADAGLIDAIAITEVVPADLLLKRDLEKISEVVQLTSGKRFFVDAHNHWLTEAEFDQIRSGTRYSQIRWSTEQPPKFAPQ